MTTDALVLLNVDVLANSTTQLHQHPAIRVAYPLSPFAKVSNYSTRSATEYKNLYQIQDFLSRILPNNKDSSQP